MKKDLRKSKSELHDVHSYGEVGAGSVVPFVPRARETVPVLIPQGLAKPEDVGTITVRGPSLSDDGIFDGDTLLFRRNGTNRDVTPETICIVHILSTGELLAKKVIPMERGTGKVALRSSGGGIKDKYYDADDIEVVGIVFAMQRMIDRHGSIKRTPGDDEIPF